MEARVAATNGGQKRRGSIDNGDIGRGGTRGASSGGEARVSDAESSDVAKGGAGVGQARQQRSPNLPLYVTRPKAIRQGAPLRAEDSQVAGRRSSPDGQVQGRNATLSELLVLPDDSAPSLGRQRSAPAARGVTGLPLGRRHSLGSDLMQHTAARRVSPVVSGERAGFGAALGARNAGPPQRTPPPPLQPIECACVGDAPDGDFHNPAGPASAYANLPSPSRIEAGTGRIVASNPMGSRSTPLSPILPPPSGSLALSPQASSPSTGSPGLSPHTSSQPCSPSGSSPAWWEPVTLIGTPHAFSTIGKARSEPALLSLDQMLENAAPTALEPMHSSPFPVVDVDDADCSWSQPIPPLPTTRDRAAISATRTSPQSPH